MIQWWALTFSVYKYQIVFKSQANADALNTLPLSGRTEFQTVVKRLFLPVLYMMGDREHSFTCLNPFILTTVWNSVLPDSGNVFKASAFA